MTSFPPNGDAAAKPAAELDTDDWDALFCAVKTTLRQTVDGLPAPSTEAGSGAQSRVRSRVLECAAALDLLHTMLQNERGRKDLHEAEIRLAQTALTHALLDFGPALGADSRFHGTSPGAFGAMSRPQPLS